MNTPAIDAAGFEPRHARIRGAAALGPAPALPWWWADASDNNTVDVAGLPPGEHKVRLELVDTNHSVFPGQVVTLSFTVPARDQVAHHGHAHD